MNVVAYCQDSKDRSGLPAGILVLDYLGDGIWELGPVLVREKYRSLEYCFEFDGYEVRGSLARILLTQARAALPRDAKIFWCTHSPKVVRIFQEIFPESREASSSELPWAVHRRTIKVVLDPQTIWVAACHKSGWDRKPIQDGDQPYDPIKYYVGALA